MQNIRKNQLLDVRLNVHQNAPDQSALMPRIQESLNQQTNLSAFEYGVELGVYLKNARIPALYPR